MASEWPLVRLGDHCTKIGSGATPKGGKEAYLDAGPYKLIRSQNVYNDGFAWQGLAFISAEQARRLDGVSVEAGDVLVNITGDSVARVCTAPEAALPARVNQHVAIVRPRSTSFDANFLRWFLCTAEQQEKLLGLASAGATRNALTKAMLEGLQVPKPPVGVQVHLAAPLVFIEKRIDLLSQTSATLESIAQALFKSWFIDFDPVRAKAQGGGPEGMDADTAALFPAEFEESALGVMPKGWRVAAIRDVVADVYDGPHATPPEASEGPVFLGIKNLTGTSLDLGEVRHISESDWAHWTRRVTPQPDDIVFSYEAALGLFALIPPGLTCCLGRRLALVRPMAEDGTPHFWFHQFIGEPFQRLLDKHTVHGATVNRIPLKEFPSFTVMDPGNRLRIAFESVAQPLWARIHANRQQALNLAKTRDTLLPRLISGRLRLPEAFAQIEEAVAT